jgi:SAM-dependent methyltransferase
MVDDAVADRGDLLDPVVARHLLATLGLSVDHVNLLGVRRASGARILVGGAAPAGRRLANDGRVLARLGVLPADEPPPTPSDGEPACAWLAEHLPRTVRPGQQFQANIRFQNVGTAPMPAGGSGLMNLAAEWSVPVGPHATAPDDDTVLAANREMRTPLPAELSPGCMLTVAMRLRAPERPGRYSVAIKMVHEGVRWLEPSYGPFVIYVDDAAGFVPPAGWVLDGPGAHEPAADLEHAAVMMQDWITAHAPAEPRVLELGGGITPMAARLRVPVFQLDADLMALQLGAMLRRGGKDTVASYCGNLGALPFPEAFFDAIVCFDTMHYVPDLVATLSALRGHLRHGGFIGLFCDPVGQMWPGSPGTKVLAEVRQGLNPQGFSLAEYAQIFAMARLSVAELVVDGVSMKVRLTKEAADA